MDMQVGHGLADPHIGGDESPLGIGRLLNRSRQALRGDGQVEQDRLRGVVKGVDVASRYHQDMAWEKGPVVQERHRTSLVEHHMGGHFAGHDLAELAAWPAARIVSG